MRWVALLALLCLTACNRPADTGTTVLTYASPYASTHPFSRADLQWMKWVEEESHGTLIVRPYWGGSVLSSEHSMLELRHGVVDIGLITPIYARGGTHLLRAQAGFYAGIKIFDQQLALYRCLAAADPQFSRELHGLVVLAVQGGNLPGILTRTHEIDSLADLKGLRIRAPGELLPILKTLGADPVDMPMNDVYSALAKGVLDGVVASTDTLKSLHFGEVAHYYNTIAIPRGAYAARAMSERRWNELRPEQRELLTRSIGVWEQALNAELQTAAESGAASGRQSGVHFTDMPAADAKRFLEIYNDAARHSAERLNRFDIDGLKPYEYARTLAAHATAGGDISCGTP
jgi:TRAP-type C4-dicarboxylate transport system substrate-binding protein